MAKVVESGKSGTRSIRALIRKDIQRTLELGHPKGRKLSDHAVHDFRRNLKRLRANLRLVRVEIGAREFRRDNRAFRNAARNLIEVRDATILPVALENLARHYHGQLRSPAIARLKRLLHEERMKVKNRVLGSTDLERSLTAPLAGTQKRIERLAFGKSGWSVLGAGLQRTYKEARNAYRIARGTPTDEALHECRKQMKYLYYQLQTLKPIWPGVVQSLADEVKDLTDHLGDDHDLALLGEKIKNNREWLRDGAEHDRLSALIHRRRAELQGRAFAIGGRLTSEKPSVFAAQLKDYWDKWRTEGKNLLH